MHISCLHLPKKTNSVHMRYTQSLSISISMLYIELLTLLGVCVGLRISGTVSPAGAEKLEQPVA